MAPIVIAVTPGMLASLAGSWVASGIVLGLTYKRLMHKQQRELQKLEKNQQELEERLALLQQEEASPEIVTVSEIPERISAENVDTTKHVFLKHLLQNNLQLQADIQAANSTTMD